MKMMKILEAKTNYFEDIQNELDEIIQYRLIENEKFIKSSKDICYLNVPISFDIETSSFYENSEKKAILYIWQADLNGQVIFGRTWQEWLCLMAKLTNLLKLNEKRRIIIYVHNLEYEFQFMRKWIKWSKVFAVKERRVLYALTENGIEFRCSYLLSGYSLENVGKNLMKYPVEKMVGDLDYELLRNSKTALSDKELKYCENDVRVVTHYIQEMIEKYGDITKLQLTKTGFVRQHVRNACLYADKDHKKGTDKYNDYMKIMKSMNLTVSEYKQLKRAFQGGFTHANACYSGLIENDVSSYDFTSSYPAVMLSEKFPMSKARLKKIKTKEQLYFYLNRYCCLFDIEFNDIEKTTLYESYISISKCYIKENYVDDNGRLVYASKIKTTITEQDYFIIEKMYKWSSMRVSNFRIYFKTYLPKEFINSILELYVNKTTLKGVKGKEVEYANAKELLNSCYGMCVTDVVQEENEYTNDEWQEKKLADFDDSIQKYNSSKKRFLCYQWGIWVTAYARRNLFTAINNIKNDYIYSDTDSVKILNNDKHIEYFKEYNNNIINKLHRMCDFYNIEYDKISPKTITGKVKTIGLWDYEGTYTAFKTLGAKRYLINDNNELKLTVSGLNKKSCVPYLFYKYKTIDNIFKHFDDDLVIPKTSEVIKNPTGKETHTYIDDEIKGTVTDYQGNTAEYYEKSCIHLENAEYSLNLTEAYIDYIMGVRENFN